MAREEEDDDDVNEDLLGAASIGSPSGPAGSWCIFDNPLGCPAGETIGNVGIEEGEEEEEVSIRGRGKRSENGKKGVTEKRPDSELSLASSWWTD